jgi:hypothetical protein
VSHSASVPHNHTQLPSADMKPNQRFPGRRNRDARLHAAIASAGLQVVSMPLARGTLEETGTLGVVKGFRTPGRHEGREGSGTRRVLNMRLDSFFPPQSAVVCCGSVLLVSPRPSFPRSINSVIAQTDDHHEGCRIPRSCPRGRRRPRRRGPAGDLR